MSRGTCFVLLAAGALSMTMCGDDVTVTARQVSEFIDGVRTEDGTAHGALVEGDAPAESGGPTATVVLGSGNTVAMGGEETLEVEADGEFAEIVIEIDGAEDYYELQLPSGSNTAQLVLSLDESVPESSFSLSVAVVDAAGAVGAYVSTEVTATEEPVDEEESLSGLWFDCEFVDFDGETLSSPDGCTALDDDGFELMDGGDLAVLEGTEETKTMGDCDGSPCFPFDADAEFVRTVIGSWTQTGQDVSITAGPCTGSFRFNTTPTYAEVTILDLAAACDSLETSSDILGGGSESIGPTGLARMHTGNASFTTGEPD